MCVVCTEYEDEPYQELFIWAVFFNRIPLANDFLTRFPNPIGSALVASKLCKSLAEKANSPAMQRLAAELKANARFVVRYDNLAGLVWRWPSSVDVPVDDFFECSLVSHCSACVGTPTGLHCTQRYNFFCEPTQYISNALLRDIDIGPLASFRRFIAKVNVTELLKYL